MSRATCGHRSWNGEREEGAQLELCSCPTHLEHWPLSASYSAAMPSLLCHPWTGSQKESLSLELLLVSYLFLTMRSVNALSYAVTTPILNTFNMSALLETGELWASLLPCLMSKLSQYAQQFFCESITENYRMIHINRGRGLPHFIQILFLVPCAHRYSFGLESKLPPMLHLHDNLLNFRLQRHLTYNKLYKMTKFLGKCSINRFPSKKKKVVGKE